MTRVSARVFTVVLALASPLAGQDTDERQSVLAYVRRDAGVEGRHFLRSMRREDIEEDVFNYQLKIQGRIRKTVRVFEITDIGWEILSPTEAVRHSSTAPGTWIVAIGVNGGPLFGLRGFPKAESNFNALARFSEINLLSHVEASRWAALYNTLVLGEEYGALIASARDLRNQIEDMEEAYRVSRKVPFSSSKWLREAIASRLEFGLQVLPAEGVYGVTLHMLSQSADRNHIPVVQTLHLKLQRDGTFSEKPVVVRR